MFLFSSLPDEEDGQGPVVLGRGQVDVVGNTGDLGVTYITIKRDKMIVSQIVMTT